MVNNVGIVTICDYQNYGNRLQNYAAQEVMKSLGCQVNTIVNVQKIGDQNKGNKNFGELSLIWMNIKNKLWYEMNKAKIIKSRNERIKAFENFTNEHIIETNFTLKDTDFNHAQLNKYDYFLVGSDQVWNPNYRYGSPIDFLRFAPKEKRIAYAPSFGVSSISDEYVEIYKKWILEMESLSVREEAGAKIIKDLTGRSAVVLVDPTLMLSKEKWLSLSKKAKNKPSKKYLLTYFLGVKTKELKKIIKKIALENDLEVVNLADIEDLKTYSADPAEFIDYINSSSVFLTDSFHGAVFSILLEKPFIVFNRNGNIPSMNSRIDMLLSTFKLLSRKWEGINKNVDIFNVNFQHIPSILEFERKKALNYLRKALRIEDIILHED
ncbi:polysaccharide pyruvyl transferase family protein [Paenibacillus sp.]|uniref:polysaccharide pyruvyl transferase family protein n=1 Tax=Paenibacillus sp. TaxID=58172 RepID=UPI0028B214A6|nr:polysaccharide pyruvyl transferase family protein [Paenibacillus sp.]